MFSNAANQLVEAGYHYIGLDHFARPYAPLCKAQKEGRLHRNFQGYAIDSDADLLGLGVSAISQVGKVYCQNLDSLKTYMEQIDAGLPATYRGYILSDDDECRRWLIGQLMCHKRLDYADFEQRFESAFDEYFSGEQAELDVLEQQGLVLRTERELRLTEL